MRQEATFRVTAPRVNPEETVCVSGNCETLGRWTLDGVVPLQRPEDGDVWTRTVPIDAETATYRYVICVILEEPKRRVIVRRWETGLRPRNFGVDREKERIDRFGIMDGDDYSVENGWLTTETIVQLKLYNDPIQIWKRPYENRKFRVKVTPFESIRHGSKSMVDDDDDDSAIETKSGISPIVELAVMNETECRFVSQQQFGRVYDTNEFVVFQARVLSPDTTGFVIDFYVHDPNISDSHIQEHVGFCYLLPSIFQQTTGTNSFPITGLKRQPIGQLTVEYLVIHPIKTYDFDLRVSYSNHWKRGRKTLDVGHRGSGSSFSKTQHCANIRENTIASFNHAANHGADYVEFDVQLSKDLVPIIYHDFHVCICAKKKCGGDDIELIEVPVQDLTLSQLHELKLQHLTEKMETGNCAAGTRSFVRDDHEDSRPFPTLRSLLESVDIHVGFNVEIKWPLQLKDGTLELSNTMEINLYLDTIVKDLLENARERRIVFSCFHPDICTMLRLKQNKYPVLFLTQGQSKKYAPYLDTRTSSIPMAIHYARSAGILGIDVHTEDILVDRSVVQLCKDSHLIMFCWGEDNNDPKVNIELKNLGLDGVIYDRIDKYKTEGENVFLVKEMAKVPSA